MTLKTRRFIFYTFLFAFILAAFGIVFYSMGVRIGFKDFTLIETGGIYIKSDPADAPINVNGKFIKSDAGILKSGTLIDDLAPENYTVTVNKDNYRTWKKNINVESGAVSVFDSIVLVPNDGKIKLYDAVDGFYFQNGEFIFRSSSTLSFDESVIAGDEVVYFTDGGSVLSLDRENETYYLSNLANPTSSVDINLIFNDLKAIRLGLSGAVPIVKIEPYPFDDGRFVIMTAKALYALDVDNLNIEQIDTSVSAFFIEGNEVFWINDEGLFSFHLVFRAKSIVANAEAFGNIKGA